MKKLFTSVTFLMVGLLLFATNNTDNTQQKARKEKSGEVITMNKQMFLERIFDYENDSEWKFKGDKPVIIDFYADWCPPCRKIAPIMKELAKEYDGQIIIYKVNVDKEKELASIFEATSIPLLIFIRIDDMPQPLRGAADKETYKRAIDEYLLATEK
ncbi:thiol reductase thioredoxin [Bacteroides sp. 214]|uniref:thioredoxin family protein n=1 Tax=Bacteroides sp. 214 TaxID=2302935 RepID=UPI0013D17B6A|nr:thioredoxin domain-containing protein [Bacteroides sp. 214]NDW12684.1 thiol reductase thioredoxin [Bacteroides sp. 214]